MKTLIYIFLNILNILFIPLLLAGVIRKVKALMQNRIGSPILQPFYDIAKFLCKSETISKNASWIFVRSPGIILTVAVFAAVLTPWAGPLLPEGWASATNFLLVVYLLALGKFFTMLSAMDTGSAFGGLGASREATISMLAEPIIVISLGALSLGAGSMDLLAVFSSPFNPFIAVLTGAAFTVTALAELSRMPVDDPTTHLELTMVHEAMILENSGRNLALTEYAAALRGCVFFGLAVQTLLHIWPAFYALPLLGRYVISILGLMAFGSAVAVAEGILVKLKWRSVPNFLAFGAILSLLAALIAVSNKTF